MADLNSGTGGAADFTGGAASRPNIAGTTGTTGAGGIGTAEWASEESYWRTNFRNRPYASSDRNFDYYSGAYRYGVESANRYPGRKWNEIEGDLRSGWEKYQHKSQSAWENIKDAVRDAWDRVTGHHHDVEKGMSASGREAGKKY
jgi:hypothetical protein